MNELRRTFLGRAAMACLAQSALARFVSADCFHDGDIADAWILKSRGKLGAVAGRLVLGRFVERMYFLRRSVRWDPNPGQAPKAVEVPTGFVTDFASIPRIFWSALPPDGPYTYAAIIHDYLYWKQSRPREEADLILKYAMEDFKIDAVTVGAIYGAVRLEGQSAWDGNAKLKKAGERRVLAQWPDDAGDPTITWAKWKAEADVFSAE